MTDDDRKKLQDELFTSRKLEAIGVLAGGIAHDFNNLLFVIMGNINMAQLKIGREHQAQRHLVEAEKACLRAKDLTQKFITFSSGGGLAKCRISLGTLVASIADLVLRGSTTTWEIKGAEDLWDVEVDENQMRQVFTSLIENAGEAMSTGGLISIRTENVVIDGSEPGGIDPGEGRYVKVFIADEGIGIAPENMSSIFDPYFSTKYRGCQKGMGFGLAIAHSVVKKHNGSIKVESLPGRGTTVSVLIPAADLRRQVIPAARPDFTSPRKRILVMEDEEMPRELIEAMLQLLGYEVDTALDGQRAVELYSQSLSSGRNYDAVILDLAVKVGMGGRQAMGKIKLLNPQVRAIVSSGYSTATIMSDIADCGFCDVLKKPYDLEALQLTLDRILS
ncbi:MAG: ATP-binding protein [Syntrophobacteraceae bacterium]|nr:ATP-binding protein [Syntrophobacteraceae bacterium]